MSGSARHAAAGLRVPHAKFLKTTLVGHHFVQLDEMRFPLWGYQQLRRP